MGPNFALICISLTQFNSMTAVPSTVIKDITFWSFWNITAQQQKKANECFQTSLVKQPAK